MEGPDGVSRLLTTSTLLRPSVRNALILEVSKKAEDIDDQITSLMDQVRQRFDKAGVSIQDVQIRFKGLSVTGMAAVKPAAPSAKYLLVEAVQVRPACCWDEGRRDAVHQVASLLSAWMQ